MKGDLYPYYDHELRFIREMGAEFAKSYPEVARRLLLEPSKCEDPHVERMIEAFALIAARIHHKIDDEFPEVTEALLGVLYPHYIRPVPSMSIARFDREPGQAKATAGYDIARGTLVYTRPVGGAPCTFRTCYPVTIWPIEVASASLAPASHVTTHDSRAASVIRLGMRCPSVPLYSLDVNSLRFYLNGDGELVHTLYELIHNNALRIVIRDPNNTNVQAELPRRCVAAVGFGRDEGMLPYPDRSFMGYRLLQEYFAFPEKFLFFDISGIGPQIRRNFGDQFEILIYLTEYQRKDRLQRIENNVSARNFQLGCTPIVNLFTKAAEPVRLAETRYEYRIIPDVHRPLATEVYSVDRVVSAGAHDGAIHEYQPFYSLRHDDFSGSLRYWTSSRRASARKDDNGTEVYLRLVDISLQPALPIGVEVLTPYVTCTNRDIPGQLPITAESGGELSIEGAPSVRVRCLTKPTPSIRPALGPPFRRGLQWRLISHLSLNHLSIVDGGRTALQEILRLYDFSGSASIRTQIDGITGVTSEARTARIISDKGVVFCQGIGVRVDFDEDAFAGSGVYLMASVLERFLGLYAAINSFSQLTAATRQRKGTLRQWQPRSGEQVLL
jgi:type VI secretion system protein ImpG